MHSTVSDPSRGPVAEAGCSTNGRERDAFVVLTINAGSSSVKFGVFDTVARTQLFQAEIERAARVEDAIERIPQMLKAKGVAALNAFGHRVAHGGTKFRNTCVIDLAVIAGIEGCVPQVAVFDTAFHQTIPARASTYAVPQSWREAGLQRYGFHGTSHRYVILRVAEVLKCNATELRIIGCHLGNGASVCAIDRGVSVDSSMGMTLLEGLVMGTRSGDVDPGVFSYLQRSLGLSVADIDDARNAGARNQIEITEAEAYQVGIDVPVRLSGDTAGTPVVTLRGPRGSIETDGLIVAKRHIHMQTDEANAAHLDRVGAGELVTVAGCTAQFTGARAPASRMEKSCCLD